MGWSSLTHNRVLHHAVARSLRESNVRIPIEDTSPSQQRDTGQQAGHNPLRMDVTTEAGALFDNDPRHKRKTLSLDLTIVNPCVSSNLGGMRHGRLENTSPTQLSGRKTSIGARFPLYLLPPSSRYVDVWRARSRRARLYKRIGSPTH